MTDNKETGKKLNATDPNAQTATAASDDDTASILFASNVESESSVIAAQGSSVLAVRKTSDCQSKGSGKFNFCSTKTNVPANVPFNSKSTTDFPDIPWPEEPCSVRELYKGYITPGDPFLNPLPKMPPRTLPKSDTNRPKQHIWKSLPPAPAGYSHETYMRLREAERKEIQMKMAEIVEAEKKEAEKKEAELKTKEDTSAGGKDDSQTGHKTE